MTAPDLTWNVVADVRHLLAFPFMQNAMLGRDDRRGARRSRRLVHGPTRAVVRRPHDVGRRLPGRGRSRPGSGCQQPRGLFHVLHRGCADPRGGAAARSRRGREESSVIGALQAFALALGLLFVSLFKGFLGGVNALLFGSFLGITNSQVVTLRCWRSAGLAVLCGHRAAARLRLGGCRCGCRPRGARPAAVGRVPAAACHHDRRSQPAHRRAAGLRAARGAGRGGPALDRRPSACRCRWLSSSACCHLARARRRLLLGVPDRLLHHVFRIRASISVVSVGGPAAVRQARRCIRSCRQRPTTLCRLPA